MLRIIRRATLCNLLQIFRSLNQIRLEIDLLIIEVIIKLTHLPNIITVCIHLRHEFVYMRVAERIYA